MLAQPESQAIRAKTVYREKMTDALLTRTQLPDALRVLSEAYPRQNWETDPGFDELTRFWLERHIMFRRLLDQMRDHAENLLDHAIDPDRFRAWTARYGGMFINGLHEHHTIEDSYYFPKLMGHDQRLERGFDILDADHHALDAALQTLVTAANATLSPIPDRATLQDSAGTYLEELETIAQLLNRHLIDEEELVVPIILRYGAPQMG